MEGCGTGCGRGRGEWAFCESACVGRCRIIIVDPHGSGLGACESSIDMYNNDVEWIQGGCKGWFH